jgi:hypothetical protein
MLPYPLTQIPRDQEIGSMTTDQAYDTRKCYAAIAVRIAAVIPPRKNAEPWKPSADGTIAKNDALPASKYLGRALWQSWNGYQGRSRVETKMHCVNLLCQRLMECNFHLQVENIQVRIAALNVYPALGIPITKAVG